MTLILASTSPIRRTMLAEAGLEFDCVSPGIDESQYKKDGLEPQALALALAKAKAEAVSAIEREAWCIGSDSVVAVDGRIFDKPTDRAAAEEHLRFFSGKEMVLTSAVALATGGSSDWAMADSARLRVRRLSDEFIRDYLDAEWPDVAYCVGVFRMESRGVQLFDSIDGSHFTILGMPLLPLLGALRERDLLDS